MCNIVNVRDIFMSVAIILLAAATLTQASGMVNGAAVVPSGWLIGTIVNGVSLNAQINTQPGYAALIMPWAQACSTAVLLLVSRRLKEDFKLTPFDKIALIVALLGLLTWVITDKPMLAILASVAANTAAILPLLKSAWTNPAGTPLGYWTLRGSSTFFAAALVTANVASFIPQVVGAIVCAAITFACVVRRKGVETTVSWEPPYYPCEVPLRLPYPTEARCS